MASHSFLHVAAMFFLPLLAVLVPLYIGGRYGLHFRKKNGEVQDAPIGSVVGAALGLLAFMLAFTFQIVDNRYNSRKELLLEEVTTIRTAYLRAGLIPEPFRSATKKHLVDYVDVRVELANDISKIGYAKLRTEEILDSLWSFTEALAAEDRSSEVYSLYTTSVNDLVDLYNQRITVTLEYRIPQIILYVLFIIAFFSMLLLGYQFGVSGRQNFIVNLVLAFIFASVMWLILALDRPETGLIRVNQKPLFTLQKQLHDK